MVNQNSAIQARAIIPDGADYLTMGSTAVLHINKLGFDKFSINASDFEPMIRYLQISPLQPNPADNPYFQTLLALRFLVH